MLVYNQHTAHELAQALLDACDAMEADKTLEVITIDKMSGLFVCSTDSVVTDDTWVAITRDELAS
tara:strand:+ start:778 stop:972 length:195 start_codon:yes stop_codon:yes gene_type:complete